MVNQALTEHVFDLRQKGIEYFIAFSGGSNVPEEKIDQILSDAFHHLAGYSNVAIITGGTKGGLPGGAALAAQESGLITYGIFPETGSKYAVREQLTRVEIVEPRFGRSEWGDEAEIFAKLANGVVMIEGANGTLIEYAHLMKINERRLKADSEQSPIYIAPVEGLGGVSEIIRSHLIFKPGLEAVLPDKPITNGGVAIDYLIEKLGIIKPMALPEVQNG